MAALPLSSLMLLLPPEPSDEAEALAASVIELEDCFREPLIDRRNDKSFRRLSPCGLLWFSCGTCTRSRISPCISWRFDENQVLPAS